MERRGRHEAVRQCAVTRARRSVDELLRFVADPEGRIVADLKRRLPGRGVWLTAASDIVATAVGRGVFGRALRRSVRTDESLVAAVDRLLEKAALGGLGLANKAGNVVVGFDAVDRAIAGRRVVGLVHACDAAADGCRKLDRRYQRLRPDADVSSSVIRSFSVEQLSLALGRPNVVHAALTEGGASASFVAAVRRLEKFRAGSAAFDAA